MALGQAFVSVHADLKPFKRELDTELKRILKELDIRLAKAGKETSDKFIDEFLNQMKSRSNEIGKKLSGVFSKFRPKIRPDVDDREADRVGSRLVSRLNRILSRGLRFFGPLSFLKGQTDVDNFARGVRGAFRLLENVFKVFGKAGTAVANTIGKIGENAVKLIKNLKGVANSLGIILKAGIPVFGISGIFGALIQIGSELRKLIGLAALLPGALAVVAAAITPIKAAWMGVSEAIEALVQGDMDEFKKAMDKLTPSAQRFVRAFQKILPGLRKIRDAAQQAFFSVGGKGGLGEALERAAKALLPAVEEGFKKVAASAGSFVANLLGMAQHPAILNLLNNLFPTVSRIIERLSGPVTELLLALARAADRSLPTIESLADKLAEMIGRFATWLNESIANGEFDQWISDALETMAQLKTTGELVLGVLDALFDRADEGGKSFLAGLNEALAKLEKWLRSEEGKKFIDRMIVSAEALAATFIFIGSSIGYVSEQIGKVKKALDSIPGAARNAFSAISELLTLGTPLGALRSQIPGFANGGIVTKPTIAMVGEGGGPEAIIPLNNPRRAREVMQQAGLMGMSEQVVNVYIGDEQLDSRMVKVAKQVNRGTAKSLSYQPRTV